MKIKVTFRLIGGKDTTVTMEVPQESIADLLREDCFTDIANKASTPKQGAVHDTDILERLKTSTKTVRT